MNYRRPDLANRHHRGGYCARRSSEVAMQAAVQALPDSSVSVRANTVGVNADELSGFVQRYLGHNIGDQQASRTMLRALASRLLLSDEASTRMTDAEIGEEILKLLAYPFRDRPGFDLAWSPAI
jgi:hypothetical protein